MNWLLAIGHRRAWSSCRVEGEGHQLQDLRSTKAGYAWWMLQTGNVIAIKWLCWCAGWWLLMVVECCWWPWTVQHTWQCLAMRRLDSELNGLKSDEEGQKLSQLPGNAANFPLLHPVHLYTIWIYLDPAKTRNLLGWTIVCFVFCFYRALELTSSKTALPWLI